MCHPFLMCVTLSLKHGTVRPEHHPYKDTLTLVELELKGSLGNPVGPLRLLNDYSAHAVINLKFISAP